VSCRCSFTSLFDTLALGDGREIEVAEDGTVLEVATIVQLKDVPEAAAAAVWKLVEDEPASA